MEDRQNPRNALSVLGKGLRATGAQSLLLLDHHSTEQKLPTSQEPSRHPDTDHISSQLLFTELPKPKFVNCRLQAKFLESMNYSSWHSESSTVLETNHGHQEHRCYFRNVSHQTCPRTSSPRTPSPSHSTSQDKDVCCHHAQHPPVVDAKGPALHPTCFQPLEMCNLASAKERVQLSSTSLHIAPRVTPRISRLAGHEGR